MATSRDLSRQISDTIKSRGGQRSALRDKLEQERGLDDRRQNLDSIRKTVLDTERQLSGLADDVGTRTRGRLMTNAQKNRLISKEREPLAGSLADLSRQEETSAVGLDRILGDINQLLASDEADYNSRLQWLMNQRNDMMADERAQRQMDFQRQQNEAQRALQKALNARPSFDMSPLAALLDPNSQLNQARSRSDALRTMLGRQGTQNISQIGDAVGGAVRNVAPTLTDAITKARNKSPIDYLRNAGSNLLGKIF